MWFTKIYTIDYDIFVGAMSDDEMRRKSSKETSTTKSMMVIGRSIERGKY
jgi:hypothetical protein